MIRNQSKKLVYFELKNIHELIANIYHIFIILSPKGIGKTYSAIKLCLKNWEIDRHSFAYVFRYQVEIECFINELKTLLPCKYRVKKEKVITVIYDGQQLAGILTAVSQAHYVKNIQSLDLIIFDEVISANERYLKNEMKQIYLLVSNLIRTKEKWNMYLLGNYHGPDNPIFNFFKMYRWHYDKFGFLTDGNIGYYELKSNEYKNVINSQGANFLTEYDTQLSQKYVKGGFTAHDLNMIQCQEIEVYEYLYAVIYCEKKIYVSKTIDNMLYFSNEGKTEIIYPLTFEDGLKYNNVNIRGKEISEWWTNMINKKLVIFEDFTIKNLIIDYLAITNLSYEN